MRLPTSPARGRAGFTLIELLVVIGIIAVLAALSMGTYFRVMNSQAQKRSETTVKKIYTGLHTQWSAVITEVKDEIKNGKVPATIMTNLASNDRDRANVIYMKMRLAQEFPMTFAEALNPAPGYLNAKPHYKQTLTGLSGGSNQDQSSACLYLALTLNRGAGFNADDLGPGLVKPLSFTGATLNGFVDSWGATIWWARWTQDNGYATEMGSTLGNRDADDPLGKLSVAWAQQNAAAIALKHPFDGSLYPFNSPASSPQYNRGPYIHCAGPDKQPDTPDDILSWRLLKEGQRGN